VKPYCARRSAAIVKILITGMKVAKHLTVILAVIITVGTVANISYLFARWQHDICLYTVELVSPVSTLFFFSEKRNEIFFALVYRNYSIVR